MGLFFSLLSTNSILFRFETKYNKNRGLNSGKADLNGLKGLIDVFILTMFDAKPQKHTGHLSHPESIKSTLDLDLALRQAPTALNATVLLFPLLRCHNGGEPGLDGGEMGVIKSGPQGATHRCRTYGVAASLRRCRRMLFVFS